MTPTSLRLASASDVPEIFHVRTSVEESHMTESELATVGITRETVSAMLDSGDARAWCAEVEKQIVGFSLVLRDDREISGLFVLPDLEGRGIGSSLLDKAVSWLLDQCDDSIRLLSDPETRAYAFYLRRGWRDLGYGPNKGVLEGDRYLEYDPALNLDRSQDDV